MELLNWFKKPLEWWLGLALVVIGTIVMRQVHSVDWAQPVGGVLVFVGIIIVLMFGRVPPQT